MRLEELYRSRYFQVTLGLIFLLAIWIYLPSEEREGLVLQGEITLNGEELKDGMIIFVPVKDASGSPSGGTIKEGKYDTKHKLGIKPGKYRVEIYSYEGDSQSPVVVPKSVIPSSWNTNSEHIISVTEEELKYDFHISSTE